MCCWQRTEVEGPVLPISAVYLAQHLGRDPAAMAHARVGPRWSTAVCLSGAEEALADFVASVRPTEPVTCCQPNDGGRHNGAPGSAPARRRQSVDGPPHRSN